MVLMLMAMMGLPDISHICTDVHVHVGLLSLVTSERKATDFKICVQFRMWVRRQAPIACHDKPWHDHFALPCGQHTAVHRMCSMSMYTCGAMSKDLM